MIANILLYKLSISADNFLDFLKITRRPRSNFSNYTNHSLSMEEQLTQAKNNTSVPDQESADPEMLLL